MGYDLQHSGYDPDERTINTGNVGSLQQIWTATTPTGGIGEPVIASNVNVQGQATNVIYYGTSDGMFYAYDADTGAQIWSKQLGATLHTCGNSTFTFGNNSAPALDRSTNRVYVADGALQVHALDLSTGVEAAGWPVLINTNAPNHNFIYGGLTYNPANHFLYAETSATCDNSPWYGRIVAIDTALGSGIVDTFLPTQGKSGGGNWGFGGAAIDPSNNDVFIATGNADISENTSQNAFFAEQIVKLSSDLNPIDNNLPSIPGSGNDYDFGATPLLFQPSGCQPLLAAVNKSGIIVVYDRNNISAGALSNFSISISTDAGDLIGVPTFDPQTQLLYVGLPSTFGSYLPGMAAFSVNSSCGLNPAPVWTAQFGADGATHSTDTPRSPITAANGVVYISDMKTSQTYAFDAQSGRRLWTAPLSGFGIVGPVLFNGKLYVGSMGSTSMTAWAPSQGARRRPIGRRPIRHR
jgi:outer membrane protein assembly factor BamB